MKKIMVSLVLAISVFSIASCAEDTDNNYLLNPDGSIQTVPLQSRIANLEETAAIKKAIANPETEVPVGLRSTVIERIGFFRGIAVNNYSKVVVCRNGNIATIEKTTIEESKPIVLYYIVYMLISMGSMMFALLVPLLSVYSKDNSTIFAVTAAFVALATIIFAVAAAAIAILVSFLTATVTAAAIAATVTAFVAFFVFVEAKNRSNGELTAFLVVIYYLLAVLTLFV